MTETPKPKIYRLDAKTLIEVTGSRVSWLVFRGSENDLECLTGRATLYPKSKTLLLHAGAAETHPTVKTAWDLREFLAPLPRWDGEWTAIDRRGPLGRRRKAPLQLRQGGVR